MKQICKFDKARDVGQVIEGLAPDINVMLKTHVVPTSASDVVYNQIQELKDVGVRINDDFDALMIARGLRQLGEANLNPNNGMGSSQGVQPVAPAGVTSVSE